MTERTSRATEPRYCPRPTEKAAIRGVAKQYRQCQDQKMRRAARKAMSSTSSSSSSTRATNLKMHL